MEDKFIVYTEFYEGSTAERYCYGVYNFKRADEIAKRLNIDTDEYHGVCRVEDADRFNIKNMLK